MAFSSAVTSSTVFGNKRIVMGTYTNAGGSTGGDIVTGLTSVDAIILQTGGAAVSTDQSAVNETLPCTGTVTVVNTANSSGGWIAIGS